MKTLRVDLGGRSYDIQIERGCLRAAGARLKGVCPKAQKLFVVTDTNVGPLYHNALKASLEAAVKERLRGKTPEGLGGAATAENALKDQIAQNIRGGLN